MLAGVGDVDGHLAVQVVRGGDRDHLDVALLEHLAVVVEDARDAEAFRQGLGVARRGRADGDDLGLFGHDLEGGGVDLAFELRTDDADFDFSFVAH